MHPFIIIRYYNQHPSLLQSTDEASATADPGTSPLIGDRNGHHATHPHQQQRSAGSTEAAVSSPVRTPSRASSADMWPAQGGGGGDEDIDRLVAMHQNRSSLSSLGVRALNSSHHCVRYAFEDVFHGFP